MIIELILDCCNLWNIFVDKMLLANVTCILYWLCCCSRSLLTLNQLTLNRNLLTYRWHIQGAAVFLDRLFHLIIFLLLEPNCIVLRKVVYLVRIFWVECWIIVSYFLRNLKVYDIYCMLLWSIIVGQIYWWTRWLGVIFVSWRLFQCA